MNNLTVAKASTSVKFYVFTMLAYMLVLAGPAAAQEFDGTAVVTKIVAYTGVGILILGAMALGRWSLRALGIIGGR